MGSNLGDGIVPIVADDAAAIAEPSDREPILHASGIHVRFRVPGGVLRAVDGVSFALRRGETLGLVGESGSGKTITSLSVMGLLDIPPAEVPEGQVIFEGRDLLRLSEREMSRLRGRKLSMIFQEPMTSLNPIMTIGRQIEEPLVRHLSLSTRAARARARELLKHVGIPDPEAALHRYPHQLSGGMRQRVMIAIAIACRPAVLIADEPTTALDVTIQAQILELLVALQRETGTAILLITHDLAVIAETADRVAVMYAGRIVETAPVEALFAAPMHPYTHGLLQSIPRVTRIPPPTLHEIAGVVPALTDLPPGCAFADRCPHADERCRAVRPDLQASGRNHEVACWKPLHG
jgi:peptide/nickel transport system ATP-binding protein